MPAPRRFCARSARMSRRTARRAGSPDGRFLPCDDRPRLPGFGDERRLSARRGRNDPLPCAARGGLARPARGGGAGRRRGLVRGVRDPHGLAPQEPDRDDRGGAVRLGAARREHPLGGARRDEARLLFDPPRQERGVDAARPARRTGEALCRQPDRRFPVARRARGARRRGASFGLEPHHPRQSRSTRHRVPSRRRTGGRRAGMTNLLAVRDLHVSFVMPGGPIRAVNGVSFRIRPRSIVALVGESGSGKSVVSQAILRILPNSARITGGQILFADPRSPGKIIDLVRLPRDGAAMRAIRGGRISIIFQEPMTSLSPLHTIGNQVGEALRLHRRVGAAEAAELTAEMLRLVGFPEPQRACRLYPFELSGGLRQRAMIAMALVCRPALLIADEPTTALDVTIQAQILKLILDLQQQLDMAVLLITHDLGVVANVADEIVVVYRGEVVESGTLDDIFRRPEHPYLQALLRAVPRFGMKPEERLIPIREIPSREAPHLMAEKAEWPAEADGPLLECRDLRKTFTSRKHSWFGGDAGGRVALDGVSLDIERGECLGLVGESGCGMTTLSKILLRA